MPAGGSEDGAGGTLQGNTVSSTPYTVSSVVIQPHDHKLRVACRQSKFQTCITFLEVLVIHQHFWNTIYWMTLLGKIQDILNLIFRIEKFSVYDQWVYIYSVY